MFGPQPVLTAPHRHGHPCPPCSREAAAELFDLMGWTLERAGGSNPIPEPSATEAGRDRAAEGLAERRAESRSGKTRPSTRGTAPRVPQPGWSRGGFRVSPEGPESCRVCVFPPLRFGERRRVLYSEGTGVGCGPRRAPQPRRASRLQGQRPEQPRVRALSGRAGRSEGHAAPSGASGAGDDPSLLLSPWLLRLVVSSGQITQSRFFHR